MTSDLRPARVLYVINGLGTGGAERSLADLLGPMRARGFEFTIACLQSREEGVQAEVMTQQRVVFAGPGRVTSIRNLRALIRDEAPDLVHTTIFEADVLGRLSAVGTGVPVLSSIVNMSYSPAARSGPTVGGAKLEMVRLIDGITARHLTDRFHALSETAKADAVASLGIDGDSVEVIPRGRGISRLGEATHDRRQRVRTELGLSSSQPVLLSVGRREHQKGQVFALLALVRVAESRPDVVLIVAGRQGSASDRLNRLTAELGIEDRIRFLGHRSDIPDLMCAADVLVFPSLYEGFGGTLIEAMALGLPMVVSDLPVLREVAGDTALFAPPGNAESLAASIETLISNRDLGMELREAGMRRFVENYDIDRIADRMAALYQRMVRSRRIRSDGPA